MNSSNAQGWAHRIVRPLELHEEPALGAHLVTPWMGYAHHGIYVGDGNVVHYGALMYDIIRKPVEEVTLQCFAGGRPVFVIAHAEACLEAGEVVSRARSRLGEKKYRLLTNNCEHFCEWALHDVARSFQVELSLAFPRLLGERLQAAMARLVRRLLTVRRPAPIRIPK
ncbi:MAG: lecithin retinol acyltransferase family protein [Pseudomonadota bacterium]